jgi:hypothetical protein
MQVSGRKRRVWSYEVAELHRLDNEPITSRIRLGDIKHFRKGACRDPDLDGFGMSAGESYQ